MKLYMNSLGHRSQQFNIWPFLFLCTEVNGKKVLRVVLTQLIIENTKSFSILLALS